MRCRPYFPELWLGGKHSLPVPRLQVTRADLNSLKMLVVDKKRLSGLSTRRGGDQCGTGHQGHGVYLVLQSGHEYNSAARNCIEPLNFHILFETYNAFGL